MSGGQHGRQQSQPRRKHTRVAKSVTAAGNQSAAKRHPAAKPAAEPAEPEHESESLIAGQRQARAPRRRQPWPSDGGSYVQVTKGGRTLVKVRPFGDDPCFNCGKPGSTCQDCGCYICDACNTNSLAPAGHEPVAHLEMPAPIPETDVQRLIRENRELEAQIRGSLPDRLRKRNEELRAQLDGQRT